MTGALDFATLAALAGGKSPADVPCPLCGPSCTTAVNRKKRVLRIWRDEPSFIRFKCARCGEKGYAHDDGPAPVRGKAVKPKQSAAEDAAGRAKRAFAIWERARPIAGTLAEAYLASRGIALKEDMGHVLRFVPQLYFKPVDGYEAALIALFRDIRTDEPRAIHRIFIAADGSKIGRLMLGPVKGAAVKLDTDEDVIGGLHIGEGVETCLAARQLGFKPTWALGSKGAIEAFPLLSGIEAITVLGENDAASKEAIAAVRASWGAAGREVFVLEAEAGDINDALMGAGREAA